MPSSRPTYKVLLASFHSPPKDQMQKVSKSPLSTEVVPSTNLMALRKLSNAPYHYSTVRRPPYTASARQRRAFSTMLKSVFAALSIRLLPKRWKKPWKRMLDPEFEEKLSVKQSYIRENLWRMPKVWNYRWFMVINGKVTRDSKSVLSAMWRS